MTYLLDAPYWAYVILWIALIIVFPVALIIGILRAIWDRKERRDGVKPKRVQR
jgi:hypothetical protein